MYLFCNNLLLQLTKTYRYFHNKSTKGLFFKLIAKHTFIIVYCSSNMAFLYEAACLRFVFLACFVLARATSGFHMFCACSRPERASHVLCLLAPRAGRYYVTIPLFKPPWRKMNIVQWLIIRVRRPPVQQKHHEKWREISQWDRDVNKREWKEHLVM
jgi:hypothetical protein